MKSLLTTLLLCLISTNTTLACGWYPFGEDVRFSLVNPSAYDDGGMSPYYYTFWNYGDGYQSTPENDPNTELWRKQCNEQVDLSSIYEAVYEIHKDAISIGKTQNKLILYLRENDREALDYLLFAKSCSDFNNVYSYWEKDSGSDLTRSKKMLEALKRSQKVESIMLRKRYRFLALRLAFYNRDQERLTAIYRKSFSGEPQDVIDYWALYFKEAPEASSARRNYDMARVFVKAPGKRFGALSCFSTNISIDQVLAFAKTDAEKASVYVMYAIREQGRALETLKKVKQLAPDHPLLDFLLIREVNKVEDWVLTPRYTNFDPTMDPRGRNFDEPNTLIQERIKEDELYAGEIATWLEGLSVASPEKWNLIEAYLKGIAGNEREALLMLSSSHMFPEDLRPLAKQIRLLFRVKADAQLKMNPNDHALLMNTKQANYNLFLFAVSREFEFQKNLNMAAGLFSHVNKSDSFYDSGVTWRSGTGKTTLESDYFYSWFLYLDAEYSVEEVQSVIDYAQKKFLKSSEFDLWQRKHLLMEMNKLYDLLGTKYIRQNNMKEAMAAFEHVDSEIWNKYPYKNYLNANPFHADFYSGHKPSKFDTVRYNKLEITKLYVDYFQKAENPRTKNRTYYYFLLGNCELNMSHYGNSWMMRRYFWTANAHPNNLQDDDEFFRVERAQDFYKKAYEMTSDDRIKALCLRMSGRCEKHQLIFDAPYSWEFDYDRHGGYNEYINSQNTAYSQLKREFPDDASELMSNCFSFERYFARMEN